MNTWRLTCAVVLASILTLVHASQLPIWVEVASDEGLVRVNADTPLDSLDWFNFGVIKDARLRAEVLVAAEPRASLTVVVIPSLMGTLNLARSDLVVSLEGTERHQSVHPSVPAAYPLTVVFDDISPGTYPVSAEHGRSRLQHEIVVRGATLQVAFVKP